MTKPAAITGTFSDLRTVKTRSTVQMILEFPIEQGELIVQMFGFPQPSKEVPVAVARLVETKTEADPRPARRWDELLPAQQAGIRCNEEAFGKFLSERYSVGPPSDETVRSLCGVKSRADIRLNTQSGRRWHDLDIEYQLWLNNPDALPRPHQGEAIEAA